MSPRPSHLSFDPAWVAKPIPATPEPPIHEILRATALRCPEKTKWLYHNAAALFGVG